MVIYLRGEGYASARAAAYFSEIGKSAGVTQRAVSEVFQISEPALSKALKRYAQGVMMPVGRPKYLSDFQSEVLYQWVNSKVVKLNAATVDEVQQKALQLKLDGGAIDADIPSRKWIQLWLKRNDLVLRNAIVAPRSAFYINPEQVRRFIHNYSTWMEINGLDPNRIWNFDESGVVINPRTSKLLVVTIPKIQRPSRQTPTLRLRVTLGVAGSASGLTTNVQCLVPESGWKRVIEKQFIASKLIMHAAGSG